MASTETAFAMSSPTEEDLYHDCDDVEATSPLEGSIAQDLLEYDDLLFLEAKENQEVNMEKAPTECQDLLQKALRGRRVLDSALSALVQNHLEETQHSCPSMVLQQLSLQPN